MSITPRPPLSLSRGAPALAAALLLLALGGCTAPAKSGEKEAAPKPDQPPVTQPSQPQQPYAPPPPDAPKPEPEAPKPEPTPQPKPEPESAPLPPPVT